MENTKPARVKPDDFFKERIAAIKPQLAKKPWKQRFLEKYPSWNNKEDLSYMDRVYMMKTADVFVTEQLELIAIELKSA